MTILQTLLTKSVTVPPVANKNLTQKDKPAKSKPSSENKEIFPNDDLDEDQRKRRNLLGLKIKGKIDANELEYKYKERMKNYSPKRLSSMTKQKRISAEEKRDKITQAYEFLQKELDQER